MILAPLLAAHVVVLWHAYRGDEQRALEECAKQFSATHAGIDVTPVAIPFSAYSEKLESAVPLGNGPDLFIAGHDALGEWDRRGMIVPMAPANVVLSATARATLATTPPSADVLGLPLAQKGIALLYRTDLVSEPPRTREELFALAARLKTRGAGVFALAYETGSLYVHAPWVAAFGGALVVDGKPHLDDAPMVRSLDWVKELQDRGIVPEDASAATAFELFRSGRAAMLLGGPWLLGEMDQAVPFAVAALPTLDAPARTLTTLEVVALAHGAKEPDAATAFAQFLAGVEGARLRATIGRQAVIVPDGVALDVDPRLAAFIRILSDGTPMSTNRAMKLIWEPGQRALRRVLRGAASSSIAARDAQRDVELALAPPPPTESPLPYLIALALAFATLLVLALRRRARLRHDRPAPPLAYALALPMQSAMLLLGGVPLVVGSALAFFHYDAGHWSFVGFYNILDIIKSSGAPPWAPPSFYYTLAVTILWTVCNITLHVGIGLFLALLLRDPARRLRGVYRVLLIVPWAVPNYITGLVWKGMFSRQFGAINALLGWLGIAPVSFFAHFTTAFCANLVTNVWLGFPFMMVVILGALAQVPREVEEAATLDGATTWQRLRHITLPLIWPTLLPSVILGAVWTFNMFNVIFLVSGGEPDGATEILVTQSYRWAFSRNHRYGYAAAYALLILVVLLVQGALVNRLQRRRARA